MHPTRYVNLDAARLRHGDAVDRHGAWLLVGDPAADAVAAALAERPHAERAALLDRASRGRAEVRIPALDALIREASTPPPWVEPERLERGAAAFVRMGAPAGIVLGCVSLVTGYCSPGGNKPLIFTGRLEAGVQRRLAETSRFVQAVTAAGGMRPGREGWRSALFVRMMHAGVRRMLLASPKWRSNDWGVPINAFDSAGTILLFSLVLMDGCDRLGVTLRPNERADLLHLWRWIGFVMGVPEPLLFSDEAGARAFWDVLSLTQGAPDDDARALAHALLDGALGPPGTDVRARLRARALKGLGWAVTRRALDPALTAALAPPPPDRWDTVLERMAGVNRVVTATPLLARPRYEAGVRYWDEAVRAGLAGRPADFAMPGRVAHA
jgi:hypothetical protein